MEESLLRVPSNDQSDEGSLMPLFVPKELSAFGLWLIHIYEMKMCFKLEMKELLLRITTGTQREKSVLLPPIFCF